MRRASNLHSSSLIRLLTFASVIGSQFNALSISKSTVSVTTAATDISHTDTFDTRRSTSSSDSAAIIYYSPIGTFLTSTPYENFVTMRNATVSHGSSTRFVTDASSTAPSSLKFWKNSSKLPMNSTEFSKNQFTGSESTNLAAIPSLTSSSTVPEVNRPRMKHHHEHHWGPFFEEPFNKTSAGDKLISKAHLFTEAVLNCRVGMLKDKTVMWVRRTSEKVSLLTVGNVTYSGDPRIRVKFQYPNNWRLLINPTRTEDAGVYMCQVSTHPPRVFITNLTILEPPLRLMDDQEREVGDRYYKAGSTIELQCQASRSFLLKEKLNIFKTLQPLNQTKTNTRKNDMENLLRISYNDLILNTNQTVNKQGHGFERQLNNLIFWTKNDATLPLSVVKRLSTTEKWFNTRLSIPDAKITDSGNYSCSIGKSFTAIVQVQVLTGELPAAVQHNSESKSHQSVPSLQYYLWVLIISAAFTDFSRDPCLC